MKIRNLPFNKLDIKEKCIIEKHFKTCMKDKIMDCYKKHKNIIDFWEAHREADTEDGTYDGWVK